MNDASFVVESNKNEHDHDRKNKETVFHTLQKKK